LKIHLALAGAVVSCLVAGGTAVAAKGGGDHGPTSSASAPCVDTLGEHGTFTIEGALDAWPPNHKPETVTFTLTDENAIPLQGVTIGVVGTEHDEEGMNGAGDPSNTDVATGAPGAGEGSASTTATFLVERSGHGDGRTYTYTVGGTVNSGLTTCEPVTFQTTVAHDQGGGNDD
jgi:hypothetical protein